MKEDDLSIYDHIRGGGAGFRESRRGLISVHGREAVQFLDGLISNDFKTLADGSEMLAAFPNAQGRLLAVVRVRRRGDTFLIETEEATRESVHQNLFRFTYAGDFFVEDLSDAFTFFELFGAADEIEARLNDIDGALVFDSLRGQRMRAVPDEAAGAFRSALMGEFSSQAVGDELYEVLRVEAGIPRFGVDMDETTIVPELGLVGLISYNKGCYIGQEIIARIHFRGHVAKRLAGLSLSGPLAAGAELFTAEGKNAGKITSPAHSPRLAADIALGFVRYDYLAAGTELVSGDVRATVADLPFI